MFGRVAPEDKLRLAKLMQESGEVVAMTGDAVNDAAALKQADIGVAMGSGSEVSKQAAKIVLTDDNFATLVRAVDLGRDIYRRISTYVRLQLTILSSVLQLMVYATILNINGGVALFPLQLLFCKFFVVITVVIGFIVDVPDPGVMQRPPRQPGTKIVNRPQIIRWFVTGFVVAATALAVLEWGPGKPSTTHGSTSVRLPCSPFWCLPSAVPAPVLGAAAPVPAGRGAARRGSRWCRTAARQRDAADAQRHRTESADHGDLLPHARSAPRVFVPGRT